MPPKKSRQQKGGQTGGKKPSGASRKEKAGRRAAYKNVKQSTRFRGGASSPAANLALLLAAPVHAFKLPTSERLRSSAAHIKNIFTAGTVTTSSPPQWGSSGNIDTVVCFFGQPGRAVTLWSSVGAVCNYTCRFQSDTGATGGTPGVQTDTTYWYPVGGTTALTATATAMTEAGYWPFYGASYLSGSSQPHGSWISAGISASVPYVFLNAGDAISLSIDTSGATMAGTVGFTLMQWVDAKSPPGTANTALSGFFGLTLTGAGSTGNVLTQTAVAAGYYTLSFNEINLTSGTCTYVRVQATIVTASGNQWCTYTMADFLGSPANSSGLGSVLGDKARVNGASLLMTNTTPVLNAGGTILAARTHSTENFWALSRAKLLAKRDPYTGRAEAGCYTFMESTQRTRTYAQHSVLNGCVFDLDFDDHYNVIAITNPSTGSQTFTCTVEMAVEFETDCPLFVGKCLLGVPEDNLTQATAIINSVPEWFFENPMHMSDLYQWAKRGASNFARIGPAISAAVAPHAPAAAAGISGLVNLMRAMGV